MGIDRLGVALPAVAGKQALDAMCGEGYRSWQLGGVRRLYGGSSG
jgi:hypothetical protein